MHIMIGLSHYLATHSYHFSGGENGRDGYEIETANKLKNYHDTNRYQTGPDRKMKMAVHKKYINFEALKKFRENELPKLEASQALTKKDVYTTAQELRNEGLIPQKFIKYKPKQKKYSQQSNHSHRAVGQKKSNHSDRLFGVHDKSKNKKPSTSTAGSEVIPGDSPMDDQQLQAIIDPVQKYIQFIMESIASGCYHSQKEKMLKKERLANAKIFIELVVENQHSRMTLMAMVKDFWEFDDNLKNIYKQDGVTNQQDAIHHQGASKGNLSYLTNAMDILINACTVEVDNQPEGRPKSLS